MISLPLGIGSLEYLTKKYIKHQEDIDKDIISSTSFVGLAIFNGGNWTGRSLAKLI